MNKYLNKVLLIVFLSLYIFIPYNTFAQYDHVETESGDPNKCNTQAAHVAAYNACSGGYAITINAGTYDRKANRTENSVGNRKITVTGKSGVTYRIRIFYSDYGKLEKLNKTVVDNLLDDDTDSDDGIELKKGKMTNGSFTWDLKPGKEALVIVYLSQREDSGADCTYTVKKIVDGQTVTETKTVDMYCKKGRYEVDDVSDVNLKGTAASLYVQNPGVNDSGLVTNLTGLNGSLPGACKNAKDGIYVEPNGFANTVHLYTVPPDERGEDKRWYQGFYNKVLGENYCNQSQVAFNLRESQINKIARQLLKVYYLNKKLGTIGSTYDTVKKTINNLKSQVTKTYKESSGETPPTIAASDLSCNPKSLSKESKQYLYLTKDKTVKTEKLSDGKRYNVCKIQCYELLTVSYSPPVAVKSGLCFQYKVTVQSKTECGFQHDTDYLNALQGVDTCAPVPLCENEHNSTQGGPNDNFDDCVKSCDNGQYSQKCINKCYKKVYEKNGEKKSNEVSKQSQKIENNNATMSSLVLGRNSTNPFVRRLKDINIDDEDDLENYYQENHYKTCNTKNLVKYIKNNTQDALTHCAEYFFRAKMLYPCGRYNSENQWRKDNTCSITDQGATFKGEDTENGKYPSEGIPMSIGRASPFYLRSVKATEDLIKSLVGYTDSGNGRWYKYVIRSGNSYGIKRNYSWRYVCNEKCSFVSNGCSDNSKTTSKEFTSDFYNDLAEINSKLTECDATSACDTTQETATFNIKVNTQTDRGGDADEEASPSKNGYNTSAKVPTLSNTIGQGDSDMFVPADDDVNTQSGILGLCYDPITKEIHYKTTITFPGSWINLKTGEVQYNNPNKNDEYRTKQQYYCTPYDAKEVNGAWWNWNVNGTNLPDSYTPTYNISASANNFGKYNWSINFQCFYALKNDTGDIIPPPPPPGGSPQCYRGNDGTPEEQCCTDDTCDKSTKLNYDLRIVDLTNLFPNNRLRGFNWGSAATLKSSDTTVQTQLTTRGYNIDPVQYSKEVMQKGESIYEGTSNLDFKFTLDADDVTKLKNASLEFDWGNYSSEEVIPGLRYYRIQDTNISSFVKNFSRNWVPGSNNK